MLNKRELAARAFCRFGIDKLVFQLRRHTRLPSPHISILTYHRVTELPRGLVAFDPETIDATIEQFDRQLSLIARYFCTIDCSDLIAHTQGHKLPPNACMITFDDGYKDCFTHALPLLKRYRQKAVFFIATDYIEQRKMFWWDRIAYLLSRSTKTRCDLSYPKPMSLAIDDEAKRTSTRLRLLDLVKETVGIDVDRFLSLLAEALDVPWDEAAERRAVDELIMDWHDIKALKRAGMDIQSHTKSHRVLQTLSPEELDHELSASRQTLIEKLGDEVCAIAYPVGRPIVDQAHLVDAVKRAGYRLGFSNITGSHRLDPEANLLDVARIATDQRFSDEFFRAVLAAPFFAHRRKW